MNSPELTPIAQSRYDGYMPDVVSPDVERQSAEEEYVLPGPASEAAKSLYRNAKRGIESGEVPEEAETSAEKDVLKGKERETSGKRKFTRDRLIEVAQTIQSKPKASDVLMDAEFVAAAATVLIKNIEADVKNFEVNKELLETLKKNNIVERAKRVKDIIAGTKADGETQKEEDGPGRNQRILNQAGTVAQLAEAIADYFEKAKISKERDDPFRQIVSFEELMTKFNITLDDEKFRPGGEFELLHVNEYVDEFGREMSEEKAHPENFLRWVRERAWFYHDFDPMANIDLFQGMYIIAGSRKVSMYEMLVDFDAYFAHRVPTKGELYVTADDAARAGKDFEGKYNKEGTLLMEGKYLNFIDPETGKNAETKVSITDQANGRGERVYKVEYKNKDGEWVPAEAVIENKEEWGTKKDEAFAEAKTEIMYEVWLLTKNHNMDVAYRQKGMPNEKPLSETLAELYSDNIWTRTRSRLLKMFNMPTTTLRGETDEYGNVVNETTQKMEGKLSEQGSSGKAFQRSLAAYYHIAEANAAFNKYTIEGGLNPFFQLLEKRDKEGRLLVNGAEVFYKALIRRTLEDKKFGYAPEAFDEFTASKSKHVAVELVALLNSASVDAMRVPRGNGTNRKRYDWEKADLVDLLFLDKAGFLAASQRKNITPAQLEKAAQILREKYGPKTKDGKDNPLADPTRLQELQELLTQSSSVKQEKLLRSLEGKSGIAKGAYDAKDSFINKYINHEYGKTDLENLSGFAVALFVQAFPKEFAPDINPFINIRYGLEARDRMRAAMQDMLVQTEQLDEIEARYSEEWAYTFTFHSGISARNDMLGIGHDAWAKIQHLENYRGRQTGGGNYPGNLDNLYGLHAIGTDMFQGLKVQVDGSNKYDKSFYEILTGLERHGDGYSFNMSKSMESYEFAGNAMRQLYADHLMHAIDLFVDITQKNQFNFDKLVEKDNFGNLIFKHEEVQKAIDSTWKHMRYGFDNNGMQYDNMMYGWLTDEKITETGQVKRTPHFGFMTLRELMFSEKVRNFDMYQREDNSSWSGEDIYHTKMGRNVFAYLISAQIRQHTRNGGGYRVYAAEEVEMIAQFFINYAARVMKGEDGETIVLGGFFTPEEMMRILIAGHAILWQMYLKEMGLAATGGLLTGLLEAFALIMKNFGAGIKL